MTSLLSLLLYTLPLAVQLEVEVRLADKASPRQMVRLLEVGDGKADLVKEQKTSATGSVVFNFSANPQKSYVAATFVDELPYTTALYSGSQLPKRPILLQTYPAKDDTTGLSIKELTFAFLLNDDGRLEVEESFILHNETDFAMVSRKEPPEIMRLSVPRQVFNLRYVQGFAEDTTRVEGNDIILSEPLPPGEHYFSMSYEVDQARFSFSMDREFSVPVQSLSAFFSSKSMRLDLPHLTTGPTKAYGSTIGYTAHRDEPLGSRFSIPLKGLPANIPWSWWLPFVTLLGLLVYSFIAAWKLPKTSMTSIEQQNQEKQRLLQELREIRILHSQALMSTAEFEAKKLGILESLMPHYS